LNHILLNDRLFNLVNGWHALLDNLGNMFAGVPIDQNNPLIDKEFFALELNFNSFEHLD